ncbi:uncharacterized protein PV09_05483 [Verruconis gallopava]|uniref:Dipeptidase n=1 Tax=Verruconis gallopava TaxID=253628 RepID=A0A0D2A919_9PEZI|nr:uncharacterized protein PV09_05483 [Verruconis gallopava]KIW03263.1 hypothetical protein PV09_05483 [Verruconis gallopava]
MPLKDKNQSDEEKILNPDREISEFGQSKSHGHSVRLIVRNVLVLAAVLHVLSYFTWPLKVRNTLTYEERALKILSENPLIDGHNDLLILLRGRYQNHIYGAAFKDSFENGGLEGHVDIPRIRKGRYGGAFWSAFMPCPRNVTNYDDANYAWTTKATLEQIDTFNRLSAMYPELFTLAPNAAAAEKAFNEGKLISPIIIEGLHQIGNSVSFLRLYHRLGVRYATLTWNCHNKYADAALITDLEAGRTTASTPYWNGLSPAGIQLIKEMNRLGMIVDLAHVSKDTMIDVLGGNPEKTNGSLAPPIFSHSSAYSVCPHPRNVQDDVLDLVKKRNSLVMVNFSPDFVACKASNSSDGLPTADPENATLDQVVKHIMHIGERIGYDHVGIGTDYDGIESTPKGLEDVSKFPDLVAALLRAGVSDSDAAKVVGWNMLRVWHEVDRVAHQLRDTLPLEDDIVPWLQSAVDANKSEL